MKKFKGFDVPEIRTEDRMKGCCAIVTAVVVCCEGRCKKCLFDWDSPEAVKAFVEWEKERGK